MSEASHNRTIASAELNEWRVERVFIKKQEVEKIRFSWGKEGQSVPRVPRTLDLPEDELLALFRKAIVRDVFSAKFLVGLQEALTERTNSLWT